MSIRLRDIERKVETDGGNFGRGTWVPKDEVDGIDTTGYERYGSDFRIHGVDGSPSTLLWRGFIRRVNGEVFCAAVEFFSL